MTVQIIPSGTSTTHPAHQGKNSEALDMDTKGIRVGALSVTVNGTSLSASDGTVRLQHSADATNWNNIDTADSTVGLMTLASGTATQTLTPVTHLAMRYYRAVYSPGSNNNTGTIQVIFSFF